MSDEGSPAPTGAPRADGTTNLTRNVGGITDLTQRASGVKELAERAGGVTDLAGRADGVTDLAGRADGATLALQRATGELRIGLKPSGAGTVLDTLRQAGCLKARFPRRLLAPWLDAVMLNTGGGVAAGDRLEVAISLKPRAHATIAAQAAERFYRARPHDLPSYVRSVLTAAEDSWLEWLPQETILFDGFALDRRLEVDLAANARFLGVETLVFGRAAMGEVVRAGALRDLIRIRRDGALILHDAIRLDGAIDAVLARKAVANGARVLATIIHATPDAAAALGAVRGAFGVAEAGASAWNGMLVARILGQDSASVRQIVMRVLAVLRRSRPVPRVWLC